MSAFTEIITETFRVVRCYTCGVRFGIGSELYRRVVTNATGSVHCPACGNETCWRESEDQKRIKELQRKLEWEAGEVARQKAARESAETRLAAELLEQKRTARRVGRGVCPCCTRSFTNLRQHMANKHPSFAEVKHESGKPKKKGAASP